MKPSYTIPAASCLAAIQGTLASALSRPSPGPKPTFSNTPSLSNSSGADPNVPVCGAGFTYCGYILRDHKNFQETDIVKAYCAAHKSNCVNGTTKTDPIQALYICVPPNANPIEAWTGPSSVMGGKTSHASKKEKNQNHKTHHRLSPRSHQTHHPHVDAETDAETYAAAQSQHKRFHHHIFNPNRNRPILNHHGGHSPNQPQNSSSASTTTTQQPTRQTPPAQPSTIPSSPDPIPSSGSGGDGGSIDTTPDSDCISSATRPGNKIELLCACGRQCLNPMSDHIGRCDIPCSS